MLLCITVGWVYAVEEISTTFVPLLFDFLQTHDCDFPELVVQSMEVRGNIQPCCAPSSFQGESRASGRVHTPSPSVVAPPAEHRKAQLH
jgi:hypothetical protein